MYLIPLTEPPAAPLTLNIKHLFLIGNGFFGSSFLMNSHSSSVNLIFSKYSLQNKLSSQISLIVLACTFAPACCESPNETQNITSPKFGILPVTAVTIGINAVMIVDFAENLDAIIAIFLLFNLIFSLIS